MTPSQVRLGHIWHVCHEIPYAEVTVGGGLCLSRGAALFTVRTIRRHGRRSLTRRLSLKETGVISLVFFSCSVDALFNDPALLVGDGGRAASLLANQVKMSQHQHQRDRHNSSDH